MGRDTTSQRITLQKVNGGTDTSTFAYLENTDNPRVDQTDTWYLRTTETRPDGNDYVVYTNRASGTILSYLECL